MDMRVPDILGGVQEMVSPGAIEFTNAGQPCRLEVALETGETNFFVLFRDQTAGRTTYPTGRFLYVAPPTGADGAVWLDFNRAYTPPCGYTEFAVCPLPPATNWLSFGIPAGEKLPFGYREHHRSKP